MRIALIKIAAINASKAIISTKEGAQVHVKVPKGMIIMKERKFVCAKITTSTAIRNKNASKHSKLCLLS